MPRAAKQPASSDSPERPYHHGNLRRALLDEALATIRSEGVHRLTLREIGARVGVSRTALYRHFSDKRALLAAVATEGFRALRERLVSAWEDEGRGRNGFDAMGVAYIRFAVDNPSHYRVMFGGVLDPKTTDADLAAEAEGSFGALVESLIALQQTGSVRPDDPRIQAHFVWSVVHGVAMLGIDGQLHEPANVDVLIPYAVERIHGGIDLGDRRQKTEDRW